MIPLQNIPVLSKSDPEVRGVAVGARLRFDGETEMLVFWEDRVCWTDVRGLLTADTWLHWLTVPMVTMTPPEAPA